MDWDEKLWKGCFSFKLSEVTSQILWSKRGNKKAPYMEDFVLCTSLIHWSTVFLEKIIVTQLFETFLLFYGNRCLVTVLTKVGQGPYVDPHDHSPQLLILFHVFWTKSIFTQTYTDHCFLTLGKPSRFLSWSFHTNTHTHPQGYDKKSI